MCLLSDEIAPLQQVFEMIAYSECAVIVVVVDGESLIGYDVAHQMGEVRRSSRYAACWFSDSQLRSFFSLSNEQ